MWIIDKDMAPDETEKPGTTLNARGVKSADYNPAREDTLTERFRLLDDDGEVCYEGRSSDSGSEEAFAPLDDFGSPNAGCTSIEYERLVKEWVTL